MADIVGSNSKDRILAAIIDNIIAILVALLLSACIPGLPSTMRYVVLGGSYIGYYLLQEWLWSKSIGKRAFNLKIVSSEGRSISFMQALIRTALRLIEVNPALCGAIPAGLLVMFTKKHQRIGDILAGTLVVNKQFVVEAPSVENESA